MLVLPLRHIVTLYLHILAALLLYVGHQISKYGDYYHYISQPYCTDRISCHLSLICQDAELCDIVF